MAYCSEELFGVADITGAYTAGLIISCTPKAKYIESKFEPLSYLLLTPVFFASIGINVQLPQMSGSLILFTLLLLVVSVLSKLAGCGLGTRFCRFDKRECLQVGVGMVCRGEVALIVANRGLALGVLSSAMMTPVIITVIGGTILTPVLLKLAFQSPSKPEASPLLDHYQETEQLYYVSEQLLEENRKGLESGRKQSG